MMKKFATLLVALFSASTIAGTVDATYSLANFGLSKLTNASITLTPLSAYGTSGTNILLPPSITKKCSLAGVATFSGLVNGYSYRAVVREFNGSVVYSFTNSFPTNATGSINAASYLTVLTNMVNDNTLAYSRAQADAIHATLGGGGVSLTNVGAIDFSYTNSSAAWKEGRVFYDTNSHTLSYYMDSTNVTVNVGQEFHVRVKNQTGATITNGAAVTLVNSSGAIPYAALAQSTTNISGNGYDCIGLATEDIAHGAEGIVTALGIVHGVNTDGWLEGATLYLSTTAGTITTNPPPANYSRVIVGTVARGNSNNGDIFVSPQQAVHAGDITSFTNIVQNVVNGMTNFNAPILFSTEGNDYPILITNKNAGGSLIWDDLASEFVFSDAVRSGGGFSGNGSGLTNVTASAGNNGVYGGFGITNSALPASLVYDQFTNFLAGYENGSIYTNQYSVAIGYQNQYLATNCYYSSANGYQNQWKASSCYNSSANGYRNQYQAKNSYDSSANGRENQYQANNCAYSSANGYLNQYQAVNCSSSSADGDQNQSQANNCNASSANGDHNQYQANNCYYSSANGYRNQFQATNCYNSVADGYRNLYKANGAHHSVALGSYALQYSTTPYSLQIEQYEDYATNGVGLIQGNFTSRTVTINTNLVTGNFSANKITATNGVVLPPIAAYAGPVATNGLATFWNSNGVVYLRSSAIGSTTSTDTKLSP